MAEKYFIFSSEQLNFRKQTELKLGRTFKPGQVIVNGKKMSFTELSSKESNPRFPDGKVVIHGDPTKLKYTMPESV